MNPATTTPAPRACIPCFAFVSLHHHAHLTVTTSLTANEIPLGPTATQLDGALLPSTLPSARFLTPGQLFDVTLELARALPLFLLHALPLCPADALGPSPVAAKPESGFSARHLGSQTGRLSVLCLATKRRHLTALRPHARRSFLRRRRMFAWVSFRRVRDVLLCPQHDVLCS